jgi:hypothetical protein
MVQFKNKRQGGTCSPCCNVATLTRTITIRGCNNMVLPGATVTLSQGSTQIDQQVTNTSGVAVLTVQATGSYTQVVTAPRFNTSTTSIFMGGATTVGLTLTVASGFICCDGCAEAQAPTRYISDGVGNTIALTYDPSYLKWRGCQSYTNPDTVPYPGATGRCGTGVSGTTSLRFEATCLSFGVSCFTCSSGQVQPPFMQGDCAYLETVATVSTLGMTQTSTRCNPLLVSYQVISEFRGTGDNMIPLGTVLTMTE